MHNNYYFLRRLTNALGIILNGTVISECFSQNKDELVIRFETLNGSFFIRANLSPSFSCLSFPDKFNRARKNSVDLFPEIIGRHVTGIRQFNNERSFALALTEGKSVLFKMHGNRSNLLLFEDGKAVDLFKKNIAGDLNLDLQHIDRDIDWSYEMFEKYHEVPQKLYYTFGKIAWEYLDYKQYHFAPKEEKWRMINDLRQELEKGEFFIINFKNSPALSLIRYGEIHKILHEPVIALNQFFLYYTQIYAFQKEKNAFISTLAARIHSTGSYLEKTAHKLGEIQKENNYRLWGDMVMANLHLIQQGSDKIRLKNFYDDGAPVEIRMKKDLSPQKNAELFYRKAKNQQIEINFLNTVMVNKKKEISAIEALLRDVREAHDIKKLKELKAPFEKTETRETIFVPYHEFEMNGYRIWVGKSAENNDLLTFKYSYKEDLWLHAKDVPGSHVLIKHQAGKKIPKNVIERAAELAAYNSKRKTETLCPVTVTPKKFVRKRKGDPPGMVVVEREKVIMVTPRL